MTTSETTSRTATIGDQLVVAELKIIELRAQLEKQRHERELVVSLLSAITMHHLSDSWQIPRATLQANNPVAAKMLDELIEKKEQREKSK